MKLLSEPVSDAQVSIAALEVKFDRFQEFFRSDTTEGRSFIGVFGVILTDGPIDPSRRHTS